MRGCANILSPLDQDGLDQLEQAVQEGGYSLVVIDTLSRALQQSDQNDGVEMTRVMGPLQHFAQQSDLAVLIVDHHRKSAKGHWADPIDDIMGSTAKAAVVDAALGIYRDGKDKMLKVTGRDLEETELILAWDDQQCMWQSLGEAHTVRVDSFNGLVYKSIKELTEMGEPATTKRMAEHLEASNSNVSRALTALSKEGLVCKGEKEGKEQPYILVTSPMQL